jgi:hypothetical protein
MFSHVGFLFRENHPESGEDIVYILDCDVGQGTHEGVRVMRLIDKLHRYKGYRVAAIKKLIGPRPTLQSILDLILRYQKIEFDHRIATWWFSNISFLYRAVKNPKTMFCSEFVSQIYQDLNILRKSKMAASYHPGDFHRGRLELISGYSLGATDFFRFPRSKTEKLVHSESEDQLRTSPERNSEEISTDMSPSPSSDPSVSDAVEQSLDPIEESLPSR